MLAMASDDLASRYLGILASLGLTPGCQAVADITTSPGARRIATVLGPEDAEAEGLLSDVVEKNEVLVRAKPAKGETGEPLFGILASRDVIVPIELARLRQKYRKLLESRSLSHLLAMEVRWPESDGEWTPASFVGYRQMFDMGQLQTLIEGEKAAVRLDGSQELIEVALDSIRLAPEQDSPASTRDPASQPNPSSPKLKRKSEDDANLDPGTDGPQTAVSTAQPTKKYKFLSPHKQPSPFPNPPIPNPLELPNPSRSSTLRTALMELDSLEAENAALRNAATASEVLVSELKSENSALHLANNELRDRLDTLESENANRLKMLKSALDANENDQRTRKEMEREMERVGQVEIGLREDVKRLENHLRKEQEKRRKARLALRRLAEGLDSDSENENEDSAGNQIEMGEEGSPELSSLQKRVGKRREEPEPLEEPEETEGAGGVPPIEDKMDADSVAGRVPETESGRGEAEEEPEAGKVGWGSEDGEQADKQSEADAGDEESEAGNEKAEAGENDSDVGAKDSDEDEKSDGDDDDVEVVPTSASQKSKPSGSQKAKSTASQPSRINSRSPPAGSQRKETETIVID